MLTDHQRLSKELGLQALRKDSEKNTDNCMLQSSQLGKTGYNCNYEVTFTRRGASR